MPKQGIGHIKAENSRLKKEIERYKRGYEILTKINIALEAENKDLTIRVVNAELQIRNGRVVYPR